MHFFVGDNDMSPNASSFWLTVVLMTFLLRSNIEIVDKMEPAAFLATQHLLLKSRQLKLENFIS